MVSVLVGLEVPAWGRVVKDSILSGWGSHFTHDADIGGGLTDGQSCEEARLDPSLALGPPALQGQHQRTVTRMAFLARRPWPSSRSKNKPLNSPSCQNFLRRKTLEKQLKITKKRTTRALWGRLPWRGFS